MSFRQHLQQELARRCTKNSRYSQRAFARSLAVDHSTLSQILRGRRALSEARIRHFAKKLQMPEPQLEAFLTVEARRDPLKMDAARVITDPLHREILELARLAEFRADSSWLARVLGTTVDAVNIALSRLLRLGLLQLPGAPKKRKGRNMGQPVTQWQILSKDPQRAAEFYQRVFGWSVKSDNPLGYRIVDTGSEKGASGGIWPAPPEAPSGLVQLFVEVNDVELALEKAAKAGGSVVMPRQVLPAGEEMAILADPQGLAFGVFRPKSQ